MYCLPEFVLYSNPLFISYLSVNVPELFNATSVGNVSAVYTLSPAIDVGTSTFTPSNSSFTFLLSVSYTHLDLYKRQGRPRSEYLSAELH